MRSQFKKITYESKFDRKYCCFCINHGGISKIKKSNRRLARQKLKRQLRLELEQ